MASPAPDRSEPVVGWRLWLLVPVPGTRRAKWTLASPFVPVEWSPRVPARALCTSCGDSPGRDCPCGLYALRPGPFTEDVPTLRGAAGSFSPPFAEPALVSRCVIGRVAGWGRVIEHTKGWRASFAYPLSLAVICVGCLAWEARFRRAAWICTAPSGRRWATCERHTREYLNMPCSMRRTVTSAEAESELLTRYGVPPAELPHLPPTRR
jgi:hypothetical protein